MNRKIRKEKKFDFSKDDIKRYSRQIVLPDVGGIGQKRIQGSSVLIVGIGALGSVASIYLTAAGVGHIGLIDDDVVELSNLQRQIIYSTDQIGELKVQAATNVLEKLNPNVSITPMAKKLVPENSREIIREYDYVIDGTDNFPAKYIINDACMVENKPFSIAGILSFEGQVITVLPRQSACYRCIFPAIPAPGIVPSCSEAGVLGPIPGFAASLQATEALKFILGQENRLLTNSIFIFDLKYLDFRIIEIQRDEECPACSENARNLLMEGEYFNEQTCGGD